MKPRLIRHLLAGATLLVAAVTLSGCYVQPDYGYVRSNGYAGDVYYGNGPAVIYNDGYYAAPGYYGGYYGCCWAPGVDVTIGGGWYGGHYYRHGGYWGHSGWRGQPGRWQGHSGGHWQGHSSQHGGHASGGHWSHGHSGH